MLDGFLDSFGNYTNTLETFKIICSKNYLFSNPNEICKRHLVVRRL